VLHCDNICRAMLASSAAFAVMRCPSVCLCVCLSVTFVHSVKTGKHIVRFFVHCRVDPSFSFSQTKREGNSPTETPLTEASNTGGYEKNHDYFYQYLVIARQHTDARYLYSNGTSFNDIEWPLTPISRSRYYSTSKNSKMVKDSAIFTMADE